MQEEESNWPPCLFANLTKDQSVELKITPLSCTYRTSFLYRFLYNQHTAGGYSESQSANLKTCQLQSWHLFCSVFSTHRVEVKGFDSAHILLKTTHSHPLPCCPTTARHSHAITGHCTTVEWAFFLFKISLQKHSWVFRKVFYPLPACNDTDSFQQKWEGIRRKTPSSENFQC